MGNDSISQNNAKDSSRISLSALAYEFSQHRGASFVKGTEFYVLPDHLIKQNLNIRRRSFNLEEKQEVEERLLIKTKNYQILEAFNKPWYSNPKDKQRRLGALHRATLKLNDNRGGPGTGGSGLERCICRVIEFDRITNYVIEDYLAELTRVETLKLRRHIVPTLGYLITENGLNIF